MSVGQYDTALISGTIGHPMMTYSSRAVPSYSTHIVGNHIPTYSAHTINNSVPTYSTQYFNNGSFTRPINSAPVIHERKMSNSYIQNAPVIVKNSPSYVRYSPVHHSPIPQATTIMAPAIHTEDVRDNEDPNPIVIVKKSEQPVRYTQNVSVKFLKPPEPQPAGDIVIRQESDIQAAPAPPKLIRQQPPLPVKPLPLIVREKPPMPPVPIAPEHHVIPGKVIPPPPRKVITEHLPQLPPPPQDIVVERWLEYGPRSRRVVFHPAPKLIPAPPPKNLVIQWESPSVALHRQFRVLGVEHCDPNDYLARYGSSLVDSSGIPTIAKGIRPSGGLVLAEESVPRPIKFVGDVSALNLINHVHSHTAVINTHQTISAPQIVHSEPAVTIIEETADYLNTANNVSNVVSHSTEIVATHTTQQATPTEFYEH